MIVKEKCFKVSKVVSIILKGRKKKNGRRKVDPTNGSIGLKIYMCAAIKETCLMLLKNGENEININDLVSIISRPKTGKPYKSVLAPPFLFAIRKLLCQGYLVLYSDGLLDIVENKVGAWSGMKHAYSSLYNKYCEMNAKKTLTYLDYKRNGREFEDSNV